jgi:hypothetical protein
MTAASGNLLVIENGGGKGAWKIPQRTLAVPIRTMARSALCA